MSRDTNFYYSFLVLPTEKRLAIVAVWDFCRAVDDAVDSFPIDKSFTLSGKVKLVDTLKSWRQELEACYGLYEPKTEVGRRLKWSVLRFNLPKKAFNDLIDGVEMDVYPKRYSTFDQLYEYCIRVASAVGLICIEIFGYRNSATRDYAVNLGMALQLTNIVRDLPVDLSRGRLYLPFEDLKKFGCTEDDLQIGRMSKPITGLLKYQCDRARLYYSKAKRLLPREDARRLVAAEIMGSIYFSMLKEIERSDYDVFSNIISIPRSRRALVAAATWIRTMLGVKNYHETQN